MRHVTVSDWWLNPGPSFSPAVNQEILIQGKYICRIELVRQRMAVVIRHVIRPLVDPAVLNPYDTANQNDWADHLALQNPEQAR